MPGVYVPTLREKKNPLDDVVRGLQIASAVYGIKADKAKLDEYERQQKAEIAKNEDTLAGIKTPEYFAELGKTHQLSETEAPGAVKMGLRTPEGVKTIYASPREKSAPEAKTRLVQTLDDKGRPVERIVADEVGQSYPSQPKAPPQPVQVVTVDAQGRPVTQFVSPTAGLTLPKPESDLEKGMKPDQFKVATFARRLEQAESTFSDLDAKGFDRTTIGSALQSASFYPEAYKSSDIKSQAQAERNFINALLRRESGASISPGEFSSAEQQYFPRAGDTPEVLAQKKANRLQAWEGLRAEAGGAYERVPPVSSKGLVKAPKKDGEAIASPEQAKPKKVIQGGHTYILNEKTGKYE